MSLVQCLVTSFFKQSNDNSPSSRDVYDFKQIKMFLLLQNRSDFSILFSTEIVFLHNVSIFAKLVWFPFFFYRNCFPAYNIFCSCRIGPVSSKKKTSIETYPTLSQLKHKTKTSVQAFSADIH